jgi:hypothetical protein
MKPMSVGRHSVPLLVVAVVLIVSALPLYRVLPVAGITLGVSSGTVAIVVIAHLGVLAAVIAPFVALRRRSRDRKS